ncbi:hypothetical protein IBHPHPPA_00033 [Salmonella phage KKP 3828]|uniref:Large tegument protein n=1 Tax=Salmonella phage KKP 3828 TaxID=3041358 RepID=A0AA50IEH6_9CAUD|nr:hypothetical protein IBHPHPPA_00033 [Salmonella phage KKP 3828]
MSVLNNLNALVNETVETQGVDHSITQQGGGNFEDVLLPKGTYYGRMVEYIELGKKIPMNAGKPTGKPAVLNVRTGFIIYTPDGGIKRINPFPMAVSSFEKAKFKQLFDKMNVDGTLKHLAQALGKPMAFDIEQYTTKAGKTLNVINFAGTRPLPKFDPNTGAPIVLPELDEQFLRLFLWNNPTKETWESLYIEKNNFIQEDILAAVDFEGSALQQLLMGGVPSPEALAPAAPSAVATPNNMAQGVPDAAAVAGAPVAPAPAAPVPPVAPAAPVAPQAPVAPIAPPVA